MYVIKINELIAPIKHQSYHKIWLQWSIKDSHVLITNSTLCYVLGVLSTAQRVIFEGFLFWNISKNITSTKIKLVKIKYVTS